MSVLHAVLFLLFAVSVALLVTWTFILAAGDARAMADELAKLLPGWRP